jgi:predicted transcriptional regulator of viral defense system
MSPISLSGWAEAYRAVGALEQSKGPLSLSPRHRLGAAKSVTHFIGIYLQVPRICYNTNMTLLLTRIQELASRTSLLSVSQLRDESIARPQISRLVAAGHLKRVARGLYALPDYQPSEHGLLASVARRVPKAVFCLLTALRFHDLTTQAPFEVWIAIGNKEHRPCFDFPPLRVLRFSALALTSGVEIHTVEGVQVRLTSVARTVADCFKFRNKIGLDVALEALRDSWRERRVTMDDLWRAARVCRVTNVMRPYLESLS